MVKATTCKTTKRPTWFGCTTRYQIHEGADIKTYVALLRGINVGGNAKVAMPLLKKTFEKLGFKNVMTYINSGNVIFTDGTYSINQLTKNIEVAIQKDFGYAVNVIIKSHEDIVRIHNAVPASWANDTQQKTDVMFLWSGVDNPNILQQVVVDPTKEILLYCEGALLWNVARENITKGAVIKLVKSDIYKKMTIRNINTVRKITNLMNESKAVQ